ncbi:MAG: hypothetical protein EP330_26115 [Deltaproteobacteria bacterium]|nr:MAG: hypothetical protein EP330_26115 [Deltaproteobacteria bacterium]
MLLWLVATALSADAGLDKVVGWTDLGAVVFEGTHSYEEYTGDPEDEEESEPISGKYPLTCVHSPGESPSTCYVRNAADAKAFGAEHFGKPAELAAWTKAHVTRPGSSAKTVDGRTLAIDTTDTPTDPTETGWTITGEASALTATLSRGGETWTATLDPALTSAFGRDRVVSVSWAPSHRWMALFFEDKGGWHMRGPVPPSVHPVVLDTTLVTVMAHASVDERVTTQASGVLRSKAGLHFQRMQPAKKARDATVVYYADGYQALAEAVVLVLPQGGTVEPLTWESHSDLIVALGVSPGS